MTRVAGFRGQPASYVLDHAIARIGHGVNGVAEADHDFLARDARANVGNGLLGRAIALLDLELDCARGSDMGSYFEAATGLLGGTTQ